MTKALNPHPETSSKSKPHVRRYENPGVLRALKPKPLMIGGKEISTSSSRQTSFVTLDNSSLTPSPSLLLKNSKSSVDLQVFRLIEGCKKAFSGEHRKKSLRRHVLQHSRHTLLPCEFGCVQSFTRADNRKTHYAKSHRDQWPPKP